MQEGEQAVASTVEGQQQVGWHADDEWMDEYRAADSRGSKDASAPSARPGMAPEEEALIQVSSCVHVNADWVHVIWHEPVGRSSSSEQESCLMTGISSSTLSKNVPAVACIMLY